jgi:glycosyltransferase involved in cell wall biosynthesis
MRVLHVIGGIGAELGGPSRSVPVLVAALAELGLPVTLAARSGSDNLASEATALAGRGVERVELPGDGAALDALVAEHALVHVHGCWLPALHRAHAASRRRRVPVVVSPRGMLEPWALGHRWFKKRVAWLLYERRNLRRAAVLHATGEREAESLRRLGFAGPIAMVPNPVLVPPAATERRGSGGASRRALFLSRIHRIKGLDLLLRAWAEVRPEGWRLDVVGEGAEAEVRALRTLVADLGLEGAVSFADPVDGAAKWARYRASDLLVLPSRSENFGMVVAEALAAGTPVLTTTATPWSELPERGCGWCAAPTVTELAAALAAATAVDDAERAAMGARGRDFVVERFSPLRVATELRAVYEWVLGGNPATPPWIRVAATRAPADR